MKKVVFIIALLGVTSVFANNNKKGKGYSIHGKVQDNTESLTGVKVILDNKEVTVYTDFEGNFTIDNVTEGEHTLSLSLVTYNNKEIVFNPQKGSDLDIKMETK